MIGMDRGSGARSDGERHLAQSVGDILSTPIGTRVMRRDYGSALFELIDQPFNPLTRARMFAAIAVALARWEPRLRLTRVQVEPGDAPGRVTATVEGYRTDVPRPSAFSRLIIPLRSLASAA
jgi:uncharacterized protein